MPETLLFGSPSWREHVFSTPPARVVKGRTRWTHRHLDWVDVLNRPVYVESRTELVALLALRYLHGLGRVGRFKEQPFTTDPAQFGNQYTPDFCFESPSGVLYAVEVKSSRFLTATIESRIGELRRSLSQHGIQLLLWTDKAPLTTALCHNLVRLRRASHEAIAPERFDALRETLLTRPRSFLGLFGDGFDLDLVCAAVWRGKAFFPLAQPLTEATEVSAFPVGDLAAELLGAASYSAAWWSSLEDVQ